MSVTLADGVNYLSHKTVRRVQETLSNDGELTAVDQDPSSAPALLALKQKRLTFTWLDGEAQKVSTSPRILALIRLNRAVITFSEAPIAFCTIISILFFIL